ncbi:MAG: starch synthase, partial [Candidatus Komeilibacteria bacterium CG_4_9_14_3_um_filter_37_5]
MKKINVVHIAAEVAPYSQTGGLGVVTRSLSKAIHRLKQHVTVITPLYEKIIDRKKYKIKIFQRNVAVKTGENKEVLVDFYRGYLREGLPIYFIGQAKYFGRWPKIYGTSNDNARYYLFSLAAIELLKILNQHFDVIHCHDWHTGLIPEL